MGAKKFLAKLLCRGKRKRSAKKSSLSEKESLPNKSQNESAALGLESDETTKEDYLGDASDTDANGPNHRKPFEELFPGDEALGTCTLYAPPRRSKPLVDIVFVHGLKGHSYTTWLDTGSGTYWPAHLLPHHVPNARIMTFGFDSNPAKFISSQNDMADHAHTLLGDLARERRADPDRKLVFVVHSLGGLVTKKALCISEMSAEAHLNELYRSVIAIAFLGTPHRGSSLAPFAKVAVHILRLFRIGANSDILEPLKRNSQVLADVEDNFGHWVRKRGDQFNLACFYEELALPLMGLVVTKESARIPGYPLIPIHSSHRDMTKYSGVDDPNYQRVVTQIKKWLPDKIDAPRELTEIEKECLQSLSFLGMDDRRFDIHPAAEGTCSWILNQTEYLNWLSEGRGLLWIKGKPGAGKSTLIKYLLQALKQHEPLSSNRPMDLSFFFHGRGTEIQRTPLGLFQSLLHQLLGQFPEPLTDLVKTFKKRNDMQGKLGEKWNWRPQELQDFFETSLLKVLEGRGIRIVVDALDECGEQSAIGLVAFFQRLQSQCSTGKNGLSICFSCRHFPVLALEDGSEICVEDENHEDIKNYLESELAIPIKQDKELEFLKAEILDRSANIFQWVQLVLTRALSQHCKGHSVLYIQQKLRDTPTELHGLYQDTFQSLQDSPESHAESLHLVQWICFAARPLLISELRFGMIFDWDSSYESRQECHCSLNFVRNDERMEQRIKDLSGGLVEPVAFGDGRQVVQFIHQSVFDFLIGGGLQILDSSSPSIHTSIASAHFRLSRSCIKYFAMAEVHEWVSRMEPDMGLSPEGKFRVLEHEFPFLRYAIWTWHWHAQVTELGGLPQGDLLGYWNWPSPEIMWTWINACGWAKGDGMFPDLAIGSSVLHAAAVYGLESTVKTFVDDLPSDSEVVNSGDSSGCTPLYYAAKSGHEKVVELLLMHSRIDPDAKSMVGTTPLVQAATLGHVNVVKLLMEDARVDINSYSVGESTPLTEAAWCGRQDVVKLLLSSKTISNDIQLPLHEAAVMGHCAIVGMLIKHAATKPDFQRINGIPPLSGAAGNGYEDVVNLLLESNDVDVDFLSEDGGLPLASAAAGGRTDMVKLLLECKDININSKGEDGSTALLLALNGDYEETALLLLEQDGIDICHKDIAGETAVLIAARRRLKNATLAMLNREGIDFNLGDRKGATVLMCAAGFGWEDVVNFLLAWEELDINSKDRSGRSALWLTADYEDTCSGNDDGNVEIMRSLLQHSRIDVNCKDKSGMTPLACASRRRRIDMVKLLQDSRGIDIGSMDNHGRTALDWAIDAQSVEIATLLRSRD